MSAESIKNPFVGLRPFESEDSLYYFGREEQVKSLLRQLHKNRFLAVVGSSGSGKSSLVRAGLIPNLEAGFLVQERDLWKIALMKPGEAPMHNLATALLAAAGESTDKKAVADLGKEIRRHGAQALLDRLKHVLNEDDANLFLVVDQFEELFRFGGDKGRISEEEAADFIASKGFTKPFICYVAGSFVDEGVRYGHAGALISKGIGDVKSKMKRFKKSGVCVLEHLDDLSMELKNAGIAHGAERIYSK